MARPNSVIWAHKHPPTHTHTHKGGDLWKDSLRLRRRQCCRAHHARCHPLARERTRTRAHAHTHAHMHAHTHPHTRARARTHPGRIMVMQGVISERERQHPPRGSGRRPNDGDGAAEVKREDGGPSAKPDSPGHTWVCPPSDTLHDTPTPTPTLQFEVPVGHRKAKDTGEVTIPVTVTIPEERRLLRGDGTPVTVIGPGRDGTDTPPMDLGSGEYDEVKEAQSFKEAVLAWREGR